MPSESGQRFGRAPAPGEFLAFGPFRLLPGARRLERDGEEVPVGARALDVLIALATQPGKVVSRADLMSSVWPDTIVGEGVLRVHVSYLRKALGDGKNGERYIAAVAGRGYCFVAPVTWGVSPAATASTRSPPAARAPTGLGTPHGLPPPLARMAGRHETVQALAEQLLQQRFVTVLGAAGIGKTTVAVSVAHALLDRFAGEVHFIELGSVADPASVAAMVASALGLPVPTDDVFPTLQGHVQDKAILLVLDNCEHVVEAAARLAEHLFLNGQQVHLLTTSREALRVEGEHVHRLEPLETPGEHEGMSAEAAKAFAAVQVFLERAAASGWRGNLTDDDVPLVAETCRRLDGVALAIELAASFVGEHGLQATASMVDDRLRLLRRHGRRTAPPRQQTLDALIAWSYDRLLDGERAVLRDLSVFVGAFPIRAAQAVLRDEGDDVEGLLYVLNELVRKSLLSPVVDSPGEYRMLETTRVYALERLHESQKLARVSLRHAAFFEERLASSLGGASGEPFWGQSFEVANVRSALQWCFASPAGLSAGVRLAAASAPMWLDLGLFNECHHWCHQALDGMGAAERGTPIELRLREALASSALFSSRGLRDNVHPSLLRGLELARAFGDGDREIALLGCLNNFLIRTGDWSGALEVAKQSFVAAQRAKTTGAVRAHWMLGLSHHCCGNLALSQEHCEAGLRLAATSGEEPIFFFRYPQVVLTLARTLWLRGQADRALAIARPVLDEAQSPNSPVDRCITLLLAEQLFVWRGEWDEAERLSDILTKHVERYSLASHRGVAAFLKGELLVKTGRPREGVTLLRSARWMLKGARNASHDTYLAKALAEGLAGSGALDEALDTIDEGLELANRRGGTIGPTRDRSSQGGLAGFAFSGGRRGRRRDPLFGRRDRAKPGGTRVGAPCRHVSGPGEIEARRRGSEGPRGGVRPVHRRMANFGPSGGTGDLVRARDTRQPAGPAQGTVIRAFNNTERELGGGAHQCGRPDA